MKIKIRTQQDPTKWEKRIDMDGRTVYVIGDVISVKVISHGDNFED